MEKKIEEGPPIYMESCLSVSDYRLMSRRFWNTYGSPVTRPLSVFKEGEFKCRYRMGGSLTTDEISTINKLMDKLIKEYVTPKIQTT